MATARIRDAISLKFRDQELDANGRYPERHADFCRKYCNPLEYWPIHVDPVEHEKEVQEFSDNHSPWIEKKSTKNMP